MLARVFSGATVGLESVPASNKVRKLFFYIRRFFPLFVLQKEVPLILGLIVTDRCNLACKGCRVSNRGKNDLTMKQITTKLRGFYQKGFRELYISGGEPFLWKDGKYVLNDVVRKAREIGYFHVHVFTNGLSPLTSCADVLWVSLDGLKEKYAQLRGNHFDEVIKNIKSSTHPKIGIVYTVNSINKNDIEHFLKFVQGMKLNILGVIFNFHTPYYGTDGLFLDFSKRKKIIRELTHYKKRGFPVFNSYAGLNALKNGNWKRPNKMFAMTDIEGDYVCCRFKSEALCKNCGYGHCVEINEAQKLRLSALRSLLYFW